MNKRNPLCRLLILLVALGMQGVALANEEDGSGSLQNVTAGNSIYSKPEKLEGKVVDVIDGDTLTVLVSKTKSDVRLMGIDAPEIAQPFGEQSKKALAEKVFGKTVQILSYGQNKDGQIGGIVLIDESNINAEMVKQGFAWRAKEYSRSKALIKYEDEARKAKIGLWAEADPTPPWQWRQPTTDEDPFELKPAKTNPAETSRTRSDQTKSFWLSTSSNVRHNSKCRYYQKTKGRACGPNEGKACKICGG